MTGRRSRLGEDDPVVRDHRVGGVPVLPAAAQIDAVLGLCDTTRPDSRWQLDQVAFLAPLALPAAASRPGQGPDAGPRAGVEVEVTVEDAGCAVRSRPHEDAAWVVHSRARATGHALPPPDYLDVSGLRAGCAEAVPLSEVDAWRAASGITYGPAFRAIRSVHRGPGRILALLREPEDASGARPAGHFVPPALLDSVFQCLGMLDDGTAGACLPWYVGRITARRRISGTVLALVERTDAGAGGGDGAATGTPAAGVVRGRATVCNQQGEILLTLDRITLKSAGPAPGRPRPDAPTPEGAVTTTVWQVAEQHPSPARPTPPTGPSLVVSDRTGDPLTDRQEVVHLAPEDLSEDRVDAVLAGTAFREVVYVAPRGLTEAGEARAALHGVFTLVRRLAAHPPMPDLTFVTHTAQSVTGDERVEPFHTALWGLARTLRAEYPRASVRLVDLGGGDTGHDTAVPPHPLDTLPRTPPESALRNGVRYEPAHAPLALPGDGPPLPALAGGTFLVTGGMGGIGLHVAEFLAAEGCAGLTLMGRTEPREGEARERLDRLASRCDLRIVRADVSDPDGLAGTLHGTGPFDGVFHVAGVLRDGLARTLTPDRIDEVFDPKISGVHALDAAFPPDARPGFFALFSSVAAVHGNLGQSGYAAANAYLDGYAARRRALGERWFSLGWGLWTVGMGEGIAEAAASRGIPALRADEGIALLRTALGLPPAHYILSAVPEQKDEQMTLVASEAGLWPSLSAILTKTLHLSDVSPEDSLLDLGLDSMMAVEVAAALAAQGVDVDPVTFFEHATVGELVRHLDARSGATATPAPVPDPVPAPPPATQAAPPTHPAPQSRPAPPHQAAPAPAPTAPTPPPAPRFVPDWDRFRQPEPSPAAPAPALFAPYPSPSHHPAPLHPSAAPTYPVAAQPHPRTAPTHPNTGPTHPGIAQAHPGTPPTPRRTLPGRLSDLPQGSFLDRRIDALSVEDRVVVAQDDYFYEPVIEEAEGSWIKFDGRWFLNLASYSYLGLVGHAYIDQQAQRALERHGTGAHGVRLLAGTLHLHRELELSLARFLGTEDAIVFSSGYMANVATVGALVGPDDVVIGDVYNHASILDGYRLSGAKVITYAHNDLADLERALRTAGDAGRLVVTDAVFSMDGDIADLPGIAALCERYDAPLMVDEAHSLGVLGATGRGITEHFGMDPARVPVKMGTLSKTIPSAGGYVAGSSDLVFALKNNARGWMFSAAVTPPQTAAAKAAIEVMEAAPGLAGELRLLTGRYRDKLRRLGFDTLASESPVVPILCSTAEQAQAMARLCQRDGLFVQPIVYPAVPRALPRLRTIVNLSHTDQDLDEALVTLEKAGRRVGLIA
ncbi:aminotransferase class I/II-fold pyridoxal phosphate-dependent enzyme [Streptomyces liangshanensis]|uniref:8-amino-7-oxononanoate synthase n=1 Tax=Streptomyces liangshanensis TaxID=2717324 RepID=A0A6G9H4Q9_9ACTN|nr:aminotransferase class I/II-fold pyridoxal phosphate-dependent enzyme [Streptomyces liangshanensis]QIQ05512.1 aminotransferase class I/II-fold pyridoxal phosphate-dependent enzyme [Streptomyces liangshanensis]